MISSIVFLTDPPFFFPFMGSSPSGFGWESFAFGAALLAASVPASDAGTGVFSRIRPRGGSEALASGGALTTSADLALAFAFALGLSIFAFGAALLVASVVASDSGTVDFLRIRLLGGSADLALGFAVALGRGLRPGDGSLDLAPDFAFAFAFAFGMPMTGSIEDPGRPSPGGSSGFHVVVG